MAFMERSFPLFYNSPHGALSASRPETSAGHGRQEREKMRYTKRLSRLTTTFGLAAAMGLAAPGFASGPGSFKFDESNFYVDEAAGTVTIVVERSHGEDGAVAVSYQSTGARLRHPGRRLHRRSPAA